MNCNAPERRFEIWIQPQGGEWEPALPFSPPLSHEDAAEMLCHARVNWPDRNIAARAARERTEA